MTRDDEVALVARIAAGYQYADLEGAFHHNEKAVAWAAELVAAAEQAADAKRGRVRDWERLEAAAQRCIRENEDGGYSLLCIEVENACDLLDELSAALAVLRPKEPAP